MTDDTEVPGIEIKIVDWDEQQHALKAIRTSVFVDEQHVPEELEWDGRDTACTQFLATINSTPVATARLTPEGQIGRMAVLRNFRGKGFGSRLLTAVIEQAKHAGHKQVFLHAQVSVIEFYQAHGFTAYGDVFIDAGIEHRSMKRVFDEH
jgi:predicted GNAT family N-acyltransferase